MNTYRTLTNALANLETYIEDSASLPSIKDAVAATVQAHPLVFSDQALVFNLRRMGEELHVTTSDQKALTVRLAVIHPFAWSSSAAFHDLAARICSSLLPGLDVELSQISMGDIFARTMSVKGLYPALTPGDVDSLTTLSMSAIVLLHAINLSPYE